MPAPIVVIAVLLEPHAYASPLQFCSRASIRPQFSGAAVSPHQMNRLSSHPLPPLSPPKTRIGTKSASQLQFGTPFSLLGALFCFFSTPRPFLFWYFRTTIFLERPAFFQVRFHYRISCRPRITLFPDGAQRFSGKMVYPWRSSTIR